MSIQVLPEARTSLSDKDWVDRDHMRVRNKRNHSLEQPNQSSYSDQKDQSTCRTHILVGQVHNLECNHVTYPNR